MSFGQLVADRASERVFLRAPLEDPTSRTALRFDELADAAQSVARHYAKLGCAPGERIGLVIAHPIEFAMQFLGGMAAGYWMAPLDPTLDYEGLSSFPAQAHALGLKLVIADRPAPSGSPIAWHSVESQRDDIVDTPTPRSNDGGILLASSGTTGTPKVMMLRQSQVLTTGTYIARHNSLSPHDVGLNPLPLWHINAEVVALTASLIAGSELVLQRRFKRTDFWNLVADAAVTWINAVPAIVSHLATLRDGEVVPSRVRFIRSASAPLPAELIRSFESTIGIPVIESYGMTEAASQICANPLQGVRKPGSVGLPVGVELTFMPLDDGIETSNEPYPVGQVALRGPSVISSYASDEYASRFTSDGWLLTGDLGYADDDGYVFLVGRSDDVINRSGEKIYPREIEEVILQVPGVVATAVIGVPDLVLGAVPLAYIECDPDAAMSAPEICRSITRVLEGALGRSKRPTAIRVIREFPRHATGKIQKNPLREGTVPVLHEELLS